MILDSTSKSITIVLGEAKTTNDCDFVTNWADVTSSTFTDGSTDGVSNGVTPVTAVAAPAASTQRRVRELTVFNNDTVSHTLKVSFVDGASSRVVWKGTLAVGGMLTYANGKWGSGLDLLTLPLSPAYGGTGISNGSTLALGGNVTFSGAYAMQFTVPGAYTYTLPGATQTLAGLAAAQTFTAVNTFSNTTPSTSPTTGAVQVAGGVGVGGQVVAANFAATQNPATAPSMNLAGCTVGTLASGVGSKAALYTISGGYLFFVRNQASGHAAVYSACTGVVSLISPATSEFVAPTATPSSGQSSMMYDGVHYSLYNNTGATASYTVGIIYF